MGQHLSTSLNFVPFGFPFMLYSTYFYYNITYIVADLDNKCCLLRIKLFLHYNSINKNYLCYLPHKMSFNSHFMFYLLLLQYLLRY